MSYHYAPFLRTPLTDLGGGSMTNQYDDRCNKFEMNAVECLSAYGAEKGKARCQDYLDDLKECMFNSKQVYRAQIMRLERHKQWLQGERSSAEHYAPGARVDGF